ncbi:hypothetical protein CEXT_730971 [Caerostris extrusa]|uniref:Uncharacterized protein n=1 Tax=Caerostris extrusa TaxID=172846 RepID=A0AAV4MQT6_CAEEX|nr:hypothetical protein CEXT_730971 [Caerostris extrusa]
MIPSKNYLIPVLSQNDRKRIFFETVSSKTNFWEPCIFLQTPSLLSLHRKGITNSVNMTSGREREGKISSQVFSDKIFDSFYYASSLSAVVIGSPGSSLLAGTTGEMPIQVTRGINKNRRMNSEEVLFFLD